MALESLYNAKQNRIQDNINRIDNTANSIINVVNFSKIIGDAAVKNSQTNATSAAQNYNIEMENYQKTLQTDGTDASKWKEKMEAHSDEYISNVKADRNPVFCKFLDEQISPYVDSFFGQYNKETNERTGGQVAYAATLRYAEIANSELDTTLSNLFENAEISSGDKSYLSSKITGFNQDSFDDKTDSYNINGKIIPSDVINWVSSGTAFGQNKAIAYFKIIDSGRSNEDALRILKNKSFELSELQAQANLINYMDSDDGKKQSWSEMLSFADSYADDAKDESSLFYGMTDVEHIQFKKSCESAVQGIINSEETKAAAAYGDLKIRINKDASEGIKHTVDDLNILIAGTGVPIRAMKGYHGGSDYSSLMTDAHYNTEIQANVTLMQETQEALNPSSATTQEETPTSEFEGLPPDEDGDVQVTDVQDQDAKIAKAIINGQTSETKNSDVGYSASSSSLGTNDNVSGKSAYPAQSGVFLDSGIQANAVANAKYYKSLSDYETYESYSHDAFEAIEKANQYAYITKNLGVYIEGDGRFKDNTKSEAAKELINNDDNTKKLFNEWLEGDGSEYSKANKDTQIINFISYANQQQTNAVAFSKDIKNSLGNAIGERGVRSLIDSGVQLIDTTGLLGIVEYNKEATQQNDYVTTLSEARNYAYVTKNLGAFTTEDGRFNDDLHYEAALKLLDNNKDIKSLYEKWLEENKDQYSDVDDKTKLINFIEYSNSVQNNAVLNTDGMKNKNGNKSNESYRRSIIEDGIPIIDTGAYLDSAKTDDYNETQKRTFAKMNEAVVYSFAARNLGTLVQEDGTFKDDVDSKSAIYIIKNYDGVTELFNEWLDGEGSKYKDSTEATQAINFIDYSKSKISNGVTLSKGAKDENGNEYTDKERRDLIYSGATLIDMHEMRDYISNQINDESLQQYFSYKEASDFVSMYGIVPEDLNDAYADFLKMAGDGIEGLSEESKIENFASYLNGEAGKYEENAKKSSRYNSVNENYEKEIGVHKSLLADVFESAINSYSDASACLDMYSNGYPVSNPLSTELTLEWLKKYQNYTYNNLVDNGVIADSNGSLLDYRIIQANIDGYLLSMPKENQIILTDYVIKALSDKCDSAKRTMASTIKYSTSKTKDENGNVIIVDTDDEIAQYVKRRITELDSQAKGNSQNALNKATDNGAFSPARTFYGNSILREAVYYIAGAENKDDALSDCLIKYRNSLTKDQVDALEGAVRMFTTDNDGKKGGGMSNDDLNAIGVGRTLIPMLDDIDKLGGNEGMRNALIGKFFNFMNLYLGKNANGNLSYKDISQAWNNEVGTTKAQSTLWFYSYTNDKSKLAITANEFGKNATTKFDTNSFLNIAKKTASENQENLILCTYANEAIDDPSFLTAVHETLKGDSDGKDAAMQYIFKIAAQQLGIDAQNVGTDGFFDSLYANIDGKEDSSKQIQSQFGLLVGTYSNFLDCISRASAEGVDVGKCNISQDSGSIILTHADGSGSISYVYNGSKDIEAMYYDKDGKPSKTSAKDSSSYRSSRCADIITKSRTYVERGYDYKSFLSTDEYKSFVSEMKVAGYTVTPKLIQNKITPYGEYINGWTDDDIDQWNTAHNSTGETIENYIKNVSYYSFTINPTVYKQRRNIQIESKKGLL